jgi:fructose/tagatose bisphosphate aldolase
MATPFESVAELRSACERALPGGGRPPDLRALRGETTDRLAATAVFAGTPELRDLARARIREAAEATGAVSASIHALYMAMGRGEVSGFTTPAINVRGMAYDFARAICATAVRERVGAVVFELARSEMGYTEQRPAEFAAVVTAAAVREGFTGPLFLQGDHYQANPKRYAADPGAEIEAVARLSEEAVAAGYGNVDVDTSTLVDLTPPDLAEQQRRNFTHCAEIAARIRRVEPAGTTVSVGGEIGEVGAHNSTEGELRAFLEGFRSEFARLAGDAPGLSKISVQTGTSHGGVPLPDGRVKEVQIDFDTLRTLSRVCREEYGLAGCVQHGASTLPEEVFDLFPRHGTAEIHLATGFQNLMLAHEAFPAALRDEMDAWLRASKKDEWKAGMTEAQFLYKTRKHAWGPFKRKTWDLPEERRAAIRGALSEMVSRLFGSLGVRGTRDLVLRHVPVPTPALA